MTTRRLAPGAHRPLDLERRAARFTIWRLGSNLRPGADDRYVDQLRLAFALHGVAVPEDVPPPTSPAVVRAVAVTREPVRLGADDLDVEIRVLPLAEATRRELHRPIPIRPAAERRRARCPMPLRRKGTVLEICRTAWCGRATLRSLRRALRPVLFDPTAAAPLRRRAARQQELAWWAAG